MSRWFELFILAANGLAPSWTACAGCGKPIEPDTAYAFSLDRGGLLCPDCRGRDALARPVLPATAKVLRMLAREPLTRIIRVRMPYDALMEAEEILGRAIRFAAERELRSPLVLQRLQVGMMGREEHDGGGTLIRCLVPVKRSCT